MAALGGSELVAAHWSGACEKRIMAFLKFLASAPAAGPQLVQRGGCGRVQGRAQGGCHRRLSRFSPLLDAFGVDVQHPGDGLDQAVLCG